MFFQNYNLDFDLHLGLDREPPEIPPTACDPPGCRKWPFEAAWTVSFWPVPRPKLNGPGQDIIS